LNVVEKKNTAVFASNYLFVHRGLKYLFVFLVEQPSQLKYVEWPSFSSTVRQLVSLFVVSP